MSALAIQEDVGISIGPMKQLQAVFEEFFGGITGPEANFDAVERIACPDAEFQLLRRVDVMSLGTNQWLEDGAIETILRSLTPFGKCDDNGTIVADPNKVNMHIQATPEQLLANEYEMAFDMDADTDCIVSVMNDVGMHWLAFNIIKSAGIIEVYDSYTMWGEPVQEQDRRARIAKSLVEFTNFCCGQFGIDQSWAETFGTWTCRFVKNALQVNGDDCGVHALQNASDLIFHGEVQRYHDAQILRKRYVNTLHRLLKGDFSRLGKEEVGADQLRDQWARKAAERDAQTNGTSSSGDVQTQGTSRSGDANGATSTDLGRTIEYLSDHVARLVSQDTDRAARLCAGSSQWMPDLTSRLLPSGRVEYRHAMQAILCTAGNKGLTQAELEMRYAMYSRLMGTDLPGRWRDKLRTAMRKRREAFFRFDEDGRVFLTDPYNTMPPPSAMWFYGPDMQKHWEKSQDMLDDIEKRPELIVLPLRNSSDPTGNNAEILPDAREMQEDSALQNLDFYLAVMNGRVERPTRIERAGDLDESETSFSYHVYPMVRSSSARVFERDNGRPADADRKLMEILDSMDEDAESKGQSILVVFFVVGIDGWFTNAESFGMLADAYPHLSIRITMLMPAEKVKNLAQIFKPRPHPECETDFAWAHVDVRLVAEIIRAIQADSLAPIQSQRGDQTAMYWALQQVEAWKDLCQPGPGHEDVGQHGASGAFPIGNELVGTLHRKNFAMRAIEKKCCECGGQASAQWMRGPEDDGQVECDGCREPQEAASGLFYCKFNECTRTFRKADHMVQHMASSHGQTQPSEEQLPKKRKRALAEQNVPKSQKSREADEMVQHMASSHGQTQPGDEQVPKKRKRASAPKSQKKPKGRSSDNVETPPRVPCDECSSTFATRANMLEHVRSHHTGPPRRVPCNVTGCTSTFGRKQTMLLHVKTQHCVTPRIPCDVTGCTSTFANQENMQGHKSAVHSEKTIPCEVTGCGRFYGSRSLMKRHVRRYHRSEIEGGDSGSEADALAAD